jgi:hypothetical protein
MPYTKKALIRISGPHIGRTGGYRNLWGFKNLVYL